MDLYDQRLIRLRLSLQQVKNLVHIACADTVPELESFCPYIFECGHH